MSPELTILLINVVAIAIAYAFVYPRVTDITVNRMSVYDFFITGASLLISGYLYFGKGLSFNMLFFDTWWWIFTILTMIIIEVPVLFWFVRINKIPLNDDFRH